MAPSTPPPLTPEKVLAWHGLEARPLVGTMAGDSEPMAYAELNPMHRCADQLWLGHCIVRPEFRDGGWGGALVRALLVKAFEELTAHCVCLIVFPGNEAAVRCYRRAGFVDAGTELHRFGGKRSSSRLLRLEISRRRYAAGRQVVARHPVAAHSVNQ